MTSNFFSYGTNTAIRKDLVYKIACEEDYAIRPWSDKAMGYRSPCPEGQTLYSIAFYLMHESKIIVWSFNEELALRNDVFYELIGEE